MSWDGECSKTLQLKIGLHFDTYDLLPWSAKLFSLPPAPSSHSHPVSTMASKGSFKNSNLIMTFPCLILHNGSMSPSKSSQQCPVCLLAFLAIPSGCFPPAVANVSAPSKPQHTHSHHPHPTWLPKKQLLFILQESAQEFYFPWITFPWKNSVFN